MQSTSSARRRIYLSIVAAAIISVVLAGFAVAQPIRLIPTISYSAGYPWEFSREPGRINRSSSTADGPTLHECATLGIRGEFQNIFHVMGCYIGATIGYEHSSFSTQPYTYFQTVNEQTGFSEASTNQLTATSTGLGYGFEGGILFRLSSTVGVSAGFVVAGLSTQQLTLTQAIINPSSSVYPSGGRSLSLPTSTDMTNGPFHSLITIGASYDVISVVPLQITVGFSYDALSASTASAGKAFNGSVTLGIPIVFRSRTDTIQPIDLAPSIDTPIKPAAPLPLPPRISFITQSGKALVVAEATKTITQICPLIPIIFFEDKSISMLSNYNSIESIESESTLVRKDEQELFLYIPAIIAQRLRMRPSASLTIYYDKDDPLGKERASNLIHYLSEHGSIRSSRIKIQLSSEKIPFPSALLFTSSDSSIMQPIITMWKVRRSATTPIRLQKEIDRALKAKSWKIELSVYRSIITTFTSEDAMPESDFTLPPQFRPASVPTPVTAHLIVTDSAGAIYHAYDSIFFHSDSAPLHSDTVSVRAIFFPENRGSAIVAANQRTMTLLGSLVSPLDRASSLCIASEPERFNTCYPQLLHWFNRHSISVPLLRQWRGEIIAAVDPVMKHRATVEFIKNE